MQSDTLITFAVLLGCAIIAAMGIYLITRRDLGHRRALLVGVGYGALVGLCSLFVLYLSVFALFFAAVAYLMMRRLVRSAGGKH